MKELLAANLELDRVRGPSEGFTDEEESEVDAVADDDSARDNLRFLNTMSEATVDTE